MSVLVRLALSLAAFAAIGFGLRALARSRLSRAVGAGGRLPQLRHGVPAVLYFHSPECASCRTAQAPALERLRESWEGALQVVAIDALAEPALADRWGVLTVPTTVVLDPSGIARRVHLGVASAERLADSLREALGGAPRRGP